MDPVRDRQVKFRQGSEDLLLHALRALRDEIPLKLFDRFRGGGRPQNPISLLVRGAEEGRDTSTQVSCRRGEVISDSD